MSVSISECEVMGEDGVTHDYAEGAEHVAPAKVLRVDVASLAGEHVLGAAIPRYDPETDKRSEDRSK